MKPVDNGTILKQLKWRYAVKKFDPTQKISPDDWNTLEQAMMLAPSSFGLSPWKFVVITSAEKKNQLIAASWGQKQISDCSHLVVFAAKKGMDENYVARFISRVAEVRKAPLESLKNYEQMMVGFLKARSPVEVDSWAARQVYLAVGTLVTSAAMLGIDACPMEGIEPAKYDQILGLTARGYGVLCVVAVGHRAADDPYQHLAKVRFDPSDVVERIA